MTCPPFKVALRLVNVQSRLADCPIVIGAPRRSHRGSARGDQTTRHAAKRWIRLHAYSAQSDQRFQAIVNGGDLSAAGSADVDEVITKRAAKVGCARIPPERDRGFHRGRRCCLGGSLWSGSSLPASRGGPSGSLNRPKGGQKILREAVDEVVGRPYLGPSLARPCRRARIGASRAGSPASSPAQDATPFA